MWKFANKLSVNLIISLAIGLLAALVGSFAVLSFVLPADFWVGSSNISGQNQELLKTTLGVKAYGRLEIFKFLDSTLPSAVGIYKKKPAVAQLADALYLDKDRLGSGFVLTADGWIISSRTALGGQPKQSLSILIKNKMYDVRSVLNDAWTDVVFLKVDAEKLPVVTLGDSGLLQLGDLVFGGTARNNFWFSYVAGIGYSESVAKSDLNISSEKFGKRIKLQDKMPANLNGGMAANSNGEAIGIIVSEPKGVYILPINYFKNIISDVLKNKKIARPYFGASYIDLDSAVGANLPNPDGAFLRSVAADSPAGKAGLAAGDIITGVDNESFNSGHNLSEILSEYAPGEEINLKVLREGKEMNIRVVLGSS
ncbi:MAG: S1C family serine protease [bacterium]